jgi:hypothetical protein
LSTFFLFAQYAVTMGFSDSFLLLKRRLAGVAVRRTGFVVSLQGEAGIGKTCAVQDLLKNLSCAWCSERSVTSFSQILRSLPRPKRLSVWLQQRLDALDATPETVLGVLEALAPFVLHIEDWHEASPEQQALWLRLAEGVAKIQGVALIFTSRTSMPLETLHLEPLSQEQSTALLEAQVGAVLPAEASAWIYARAAGNPLFTLEFFRHLARMGLLWNDLRAWHWREPPSETMPITVEALIEQLLFDPAQSVLTQQALEARALLEIRVPQLSLDFLLWAEVADLSSVQLEAADLYLQQRGVLFGTGFAHPLFREVAFRQLPSERRAVFANRALWVLQATQPEAAAEFLADCQLEPEIAFATLLVCAEALGNQPLRAAQLKVRAAEFLSGLPKANLLLEALGFLSHSEPKMGLELAESILRIPDLPDAVRADAIYHASFAIVTTSRNIVAAETSLARLSESQRGEPRFFASLIGYFMMCGQPAQALLTWEARPEIHDAADSPLLIHVVSALMLSAQLAKAEQLSQAILQRPTLPEREKMSLLNIRAITLAQLGQLEQSEQVGLEALFLAEKLEQHNAVGVMLFNRAITLERTGQRLAMSDHAERALVALEKAGNQGLAAQAQVMLANFDFESGRYELVEERLNTVYAALKKSPDSLFLVTVELFLVRFSLQQFSQYSQTLALKYARDAFLKARNLGQPKLIALAQVHLVLSLLPFAKLTEAQMHFEAARDLLLELPDSSSFYVLYAQAKLEEAQNLGATTTWQAAIARAKTLGFLFDAHCFQIELARFEHNLEATRESQLWFSEQGLLHGLHLLQWYFPELRTNSLPPSDVQLLVLGAMQVLQGQVVTIVKGQKRKELLAVLLEARILGKSEVRTLDLLDVLYPNSLEEEAMVSLRQTVFKTRAAYGTAVITTTANGYALGSITSDAEEFLTTGNTQLWRGVYLDAVQLPSEEIRERLTLTSHTQMQRLLETNPKEAIRVLRFLLESDPYNTTSLRFACQALQQENNHRSLKRLFETHRTKLLEVGEVLPEGWQDFLQV